MGEVTLAMLTLGTWVFAFSAGSKLRSRRAYRAFRAGLRAAGLVPGPALATVAAILAGCEAGLAMTMAALAAATVAPSTGGVLAATETALACAAALAAVLAAGVATVLRRGTEAPCACFGGQPRRPLGRAHLIRNAVLAGCFAAGLVTGPLASGRPGPAATVLATATGSLAALLIVHWEDLADLFSPAAAGGAAGHRAAR